MVRLKNIVLNPDQKRHRRKQTLLSLELWKQHFWIQLQRRRIQLSQVRLDFIAFKHLPVVAFRRCPNLRDLLVSAKLPSNSTNPNPQLPCGSFRCGKNCATGPYISDGLTSYTFFSTGETRTIKSNLTCDTKNLIYMFNVTAVIYNILERLNDA